MATSPRSPHKLPDEVGLLRSFDGRLWNEASQREYAQLLAEADFFEGVVSQTEPDFSARDRVNRAPKTFGFVELRRARPLRITPAGHALTERSALDDLFLRQLLKWQYPSPVHGSRDYVELFRIRPFLEMVRLIRMLGGISKVELAIFGVTLIDWRGFDGAFQHIRAFRAAYEKLVGTVARRTYAQEALEGAMRRAYSDDIAEGRIGTREGRAQPDQVRAMIRTKGRNCRDYADAAVRYCRACGVFTLSARFARLDILPERVEEVDGILATFQRDPVTFATEDAYFSWLGDPNQPELPSDDAAVMRRQVLTLVATLPTVDQSQHQPMIARARALTQIHALRALYQEATDVAAEASKREIEMSLEGRDRVTEITTLYEAILSRDPDIVDRPAFLEWNTWRSMAMLDDGVIKPNFRMDQKGQPFGTAPGRMPDLQCEYEAFLVAVEVTLATGATQHRMEGEPVERHIGLLQQAARDRDDQRDVFGLFLAPSLADTTVAHFWGLHTMRRPTREYRGHVRVIPMTIAEFIVLLDRARMHLPMPAAALHRLLMNAAAAAHSAADEVEWRSRIGDLVGGWTA